MAPATTPTPVQRDILRAAVEGRVRNECGIHYVNDRRVRKAVIVPLFFAGWLVDRLDLRVEALVPTHITAAGAARV